MAISHSNILILGAGPAGLACGWALRQRGLDFRILERGAGAAESWRLMPTHMKLVSPWKANVLPGTAPGLFPANHQNTRADYFAYLRRYATDHALPIETGVTVQAVQARAQGGFEVKTNRGEFSCAWLVNATGYFARPRRPSIPGAAESRIVQSRFDNYGDADQLRARLGGRTGRILIVGGRLSAAHAALELVDAGFAVTLSTRQPVQFGAGRLGTWLMFRLQPALERWRLRWLGPHADSFPTRMPGGRLRRLVRAGTVRTVGPLSSLAADHVVLADGARLEVDAVLWATGFEPALDHLSGLPLALDARGALPVLREFESVSVPGLFFLGLDGARNFQSRFLRGLREDAVRLADQLAARAAAQASSGLNIS